jgi:hypothetical protein
MFAVTSAKQLISKETCVLPLQAKEHCALKLFGVSNRNNAHIAKE